MKNIGQRKSNTVFKLIKSMTPTEKRYFKTHFINHVIEGRSEHVELFNLLNSQKEYNKEEIVKQIANSKSLAAKQKHLYETLLKSLRSYHANGLGQIQFYGLMTDVIILREKGLEKQATKRLAKAADIANRYNLDIDKLKINQLKRNIFRREIQKNTLSGLISLQSEAGILLEGMKVELEVLYHYERVFWAIEAKMIAEKQEWLEEAVQYLSTITDIPSLPINARLGYHMLYVFHYKFQQEFEKEQVHQLSIIRLFEEDHPVLIEEYHLRYLHVVNNFLNNCFRRKDYEGAYQRIQALSQLQLNNATLNKQLQIIFLYSLQKYYLGKMEFLKSIELTPKIEAFISKHKETIKNIRELVFHYNIIVSYFLQAVLQAKNQLDRDYYFDLALEKVLQVNQDKRFDIHIPYIVRTRILEAVIRIELKDFDFAEAKLTNLILRIPKPLKRERKTLQLLKGATDPTKLFKNLRKIQIECNVPDWMEELSLWIAKKLSSKDNFL